MDTSLRIFSALMGLLFDFLLWDKQPGISVPIYTTTWAAAAMISLRKTEARKAYLNYGLVGLILFSALMTAVRMAPIPLVLNIFLMGLLAVIVSLAYSSGLWTRFGVIDYLRQGLLLAGSFLAFPVFRQAGEVGGDDGGDRKARRKVFFAIMRGLLLAIPVLAVFIFLLTQADPIFFDILSSFIGGIDLETVTEWIVRTALAVFFGNAFMAMVLHARKTSGTMDLIGEEKALIPPFLGSIETAVVLGSVLALFTFFIGVQFRYFFFGHANISAAGYTFSDYARRGFGELVASALISLALIFGLGLVRKDEGRQFDRWHLILNSGLAVMVIAMLVSAFQRLALYEQAYGFTRLRLYAHVFMVWLGIMLAAVVVIIIRKTPRRFLNVALAAVIGLSMTLNLINVDGTIVRLNIRNARNTGQLDGEYLTSLSYDALPALARAAGDPSMPLAIKITAANVLEAFEERLAEWEAEEHGWQSFHFSRWRAKRFIGTTR